MGGRSQKALRWFARRRRRWWWDKDRVSRIQKGKLYWSSQIVLFWIETSQYPCHCPCVQGHNQKFEINHGPTRAAQIIRNQTRFQWCETVCRFHQLFVYNRSDSFYSYGCPNRWPVLPRWGQWGLVVHAAAHGFHLTWRPWKIRYSTL